MTGSLQVKNDKYYIVVNLRDAKGKRKQKWIATNLPCKGNKKRAEKLLRDTLRGYEAREGLVHSDMLFSDAIRQWLQRVEIRVDTVSAQSYKRLAESQVIPYFEERRTKLAEVDRHVLQSYIDEKHKNGRRDGKGGLSPSTLRQHKNILYQTLTEAVRDGILPGNPCTLVELPQMQRFEASFYNADQLNALFEAIKVEPLFPLIKMTAVYGLRRSEVLGLKWDSVDFVNNTLTIKRTVTKVIKVVEKNKTKNAASYRSFPLIPEIRELLLGLREREATNRKLFGKTYVDSGYIFHWDDGRPFGPDYVSGKFPLLLKEYGLPKIRFHELRHSCASFLINQGFTLKDVQEWLGHSDIKMTANTYGHLDVNRKRSMADALAVGLLERAV